MKMRVDLSRTKVFGAVLIATICTAGIVMAYTTNLGIPPPYKSVHNTSYYAQSADTLDELLIELRENVFPSLDGITDSYVDSAAGRVVVCAANKDIDRIKAVIVRDFDESLFEFSGT